MILYMKISENKARELARYLKIDLRKTPIKEWIFGLKVEHEHDDVTLGDHVKIAKIAASHVREHPRYYYYLKTMEKYLNI